MLVELVIHNFAIIDTLHLAPSAGLNILTGETGAGKSIIVDAVSLLLGGRASTEVVRTGAPSALVEGVFQLHAELQAELAPLLAADGLEGDDPTTLIVAREIRREGRNICRLNGRAVRLSALESIGQRLVDIHGQGDHLSLLRARVQIDYLDRYGGLWPQRRELADRVGELRQLRLQLSRVTRTSGK